MAETKQTKAKAKTKKTQAKKPAGSGAKNGAQSKAKNAKNGAQGKAKNSTQSKNGTQSTTNGVAPIVDKAKIPLLAGGAAVAGVAGAVLAASRSGRKRKILGVPVPKRSKLSLPRKNGLKSDAHKVAGAVADAAKRADTFGQGVSRIASSVKQVSESADEAVKKS